MNGLKDFELLSPLLEPGKRETVFAELGTGAAKDAVVSMVAFAYLGVAGDRPRLERCLEHGILYRANLGQFSHSGGRATDADVSISIEYDPDIETLSQRFEDGTELTNAEIGALVRAGRLCGDDQDELAESCGVLPEVFVGRELNRRSNPTDGLNYRSCVRSQGVSVCGRPHGKCGTSRFVVKSSLNPVALKPSFETIQLMTSFPNYCSECGSELKTRRIEGRERAYCQHCETPVYRNAKPCGGVLVVDDEQVLLVKRTNPPAVGSWSLPAGFLEVDEPPEIAAARELSEETGITASPDDLELFETNLIVHGNGTRVLVIIYRTTRSRVSGAVQAGSDAGDAQFWDIDKLLDAGETIELGHESIMRRAIAEE